MSEDEMVYLGAAILLAQISGKPHETEINVAVESAGKLYEAVKERGKKISASKVHGLTEYLKDQAAKAGS